MSITALAADSLEERAAVYAFRYRVYVEQMGLSPPGADHGCRQLIDELDEHSRNFALLDDGEVVGSLRCTYLDALPDPSPLASTYQLDPALRTFGRSQIVITSRFVLDPQLRQGTAVSKLMQLAYEEAHRRGARLNYGDCSPHMLDFYEHMGYRRYTAGYNDSFFGFKVPILMLVADREHLARVRSPLSRLAASYPDDCEARNWFARTYPDYLGFETASLLPEHAFFELLSERVASDPLHAVALLQDLTREEAERFLGQATMIKAQPGDIVVRQGDQDDTVYILLSGVADVVVDRNEVRPIAALGGGDIFGEIGFLTTARRTASVIARAPSEIVVLSAAFLKRFMKDEPAVAAKLMFNLSTILARRLAATTLKIRG